MKMEQTECYKTSAHKIQTPGNNPEETIQHLEHGESLNSRKQIVVSGATYMYDCWLSMMSSNALLQCGFAYFSLQIFRLQREWRRIL